MKWDIVIIIIIAMTGFGLIGLGFFWIYSMIQQQNAQFQAEINAEKSSSSGGGGLLGLIGGLFGL